MIKVLPRGLIYKMAKFSDPSNPGSLVSTKGSAVLGSASHCIGHKRCDAFRSTWATWSKERHLEERLYPLVRCRHFPA